MSKLIPTNGRVIVREIDSPQVAAAGLIQLVQLDNDPNKKFVRGEVKAVSKGWWTITGVWVPSAIEVGSIVWYNKFNTSEMQIGGTSVVSLAEQDILIVEAE